MAIYYACFVLLFKITLSCISHFESLIGNTNYKILRATCDRNMAARVKIVLLQSHLYRALYGFIRERL
jgi:hypothetical protein